MNLRADEILEADHAELDRLHNDAERSLANDDLDQMYRKLDLFWARLAMHIRAEHLHLFPALLQMTKSDTDMVDLIRLLRIDHDFFMTEIARLIKNLRAASNSNATEVMQATREALEKIAVRLEDHNKLEESRLYPLASDLGGAESELLALKVRKELDNFPTRFKIV